MKTSRLRQGRGFTLVELLVVLTIIGLLMAILVPTVFNVLYKAKNTRISMEIASLSQAIEAYKLDAGDYPPNFSDWNVVRRHILKRWQQLPTAQVNNFKALCHASAFTMPDTAPSGSKPIDPAEALVFWLGGQSTNGGLKANDVMPLSATGEPKQYFSFDQARFTDVDSDGWAEYAAPACMNAPYVYFDARSYATYYPTGGAQEYKPTVDSSARGTPRPAQAVSPTGTYVNPTTYQILAAGQDGHFGVGGQVFPDGPYAGTDSDNIANYSEGRTLQDSVP
jgi:prepilin-type N-terminal cleavage/methylation domain-containing protein